ncbi:MAG: ABC transporter permease [Clostridiales bacterium]|nr:ABC transporter permease [Clostridiales bacterium]
MVKILSSLKWLFIGLVILFIYAPILLLTVYSFNATETINTWEGFSLTHYEYFFSPDNQPFQIVLQTMALALIVATLSTILGTIGAIGIFYSKKRISGTLAGMNQIPIINAEVVTAISFAFLVVALQIPKSTFIPLIVGQMVLCTPFVVTSIIPKLKQMDNNLYEAALDLGASPSKALFSVVIPQILPGIIAGFLLSLTLSLDDYVIAAYTKPNTFQTISTHIYSLNKGGMVNTIKSSYWAFTAIVFLLIVLVLIVTNVIASKNARSKK